MLCVKEQEYQLISYTPHVTYCYLRLKWWWCVLAGEEKITLPRVFWAVLNSTARVTRHAFDTSKYQRSTIIETQCKSELRKKLVFSKYRNISRKYSKQYKIRRKEKKFPTKWPTIDRRRAMTALESFPNLKRTMTTLSQKVSEVFYLGDMSPTVPNLLLIIIW